jgi:hypothetical protein
MKKKEKPIFVLSAENCNKFTTFFVVLINVNKRANKKTKARATKAKEQIKSGDSGSLIWTLLHIAFGFYKDLIYTAISKIQIL